MGVRLILGVVAMCAAVAVAWAEDERPIALHERNPHYFVWRGKPTVLVTSGEHYGALLNLDFDYATYFKTLAADGLNHTRTFSGTYREVGSSFGITDNTLAPKPGRYACPWARSATPGYAEGGAKFDLSRWDPEYFKRLHDLLREAGRQGIVVELTLFCPLYRDELWAASPMNAANNIQGVGDCPRTEALTLEHEDLLAVQTALVRKIVSELRDYDNLYYEVCNEPYFGGVTRDWQHRIVDTIVEAERDFPHQHLISMNIANGSKKIESPHPQVSIFNFHYCTPPDAVAMNYGLGKVIGENETGFRGQRDLLYRTEGWDFLLAGGALYNNLDYSFTAAHPDGTLRQYKSPGGGGAELRRQLGVLKRFVDDFDLIPMRPDRELVNKTEPQLAAQALAEPGRQYAVYLHVPIPKKPKSFDAHEQKISDAAVICDLPAGTYRLAWFDPQTGNKVSTRKLKHGGGSLRLEVPAFTCDIALSLRAE